MCVINELTARYLFQLGDYMKWECSSNDSSKNGSTCKHFPEINTNNYDEIRPAKKKQIGPKDTCSENKLDPITILFTELTFQELVSLN